MDPGTALNAACRTDGAAVNDADVHLVRDRTVGKTKPQDTVHAVSQWFRCDESDAHPGDVGEVDAPGPAAIVVR
ncbi:hypothetical protein GCM10007387_26360 [Pseudoduganella albidiflava]|uniref:Uncharacterized protein n=1 Tax=Pseudoduganella albidiflava TaxID=321983 RepID=A0AA87XXQ8_9BURK|nr:hypothetical protein GCM10007387_26360 [Pseudoduganella albidiflava]